MDDIHHICSLQCDVLFSHKFRFFILKMKDEQMTFWRSCTPSLIFIHLITILEVFVFWASVFSVCMALLLTMKSPFGYSSIHLDAILFAKSLCQCPAYYYTTTYVIENPRFSLPVAPILCLIVGTDLCRKLSKYPLVIFKSMYFPKVIFFKRDI